MPQDTVGIRNKNYLNVKNNPANPWQGSIGTDPRGHTVFSAPEYGIRAAIMTMRSYWFNYGIGLVNPAPSRAARHRARGRDVAQKSPRRRKPKG